MNYIREINAFYDWLETNRLSLSAIALWHGLMHINNKAAWTDEFAVAISVLCVKTGLSPRGVNDARNELKLKGRITWQSRKGNQSATYRMIPLLQDLSATIAYNDTDNHADKCADSNADKRAALNKQNRNETKPEKDIIPYREIISALNEMAGTSYRPTTKKNQELIQARWNEGFRLPDFLAVIRKKVAQWKGTDSEQYLRPMTLFGTKFESYLNQPENIIPFNRSRGEEAAPNDFGWQKT